MWKEFKDFMLTGNVIGFAIAVIMAGAIGLIISSLIGDVIMPFISANAGIPDFSEWTTTVGKAELGTGNLVNAIINFFVIGVVLFFLGRAAAKAMPAPEEDAGPSEADLLAEIRDLLKQR